VRTAHDPLALSMPVQRQISSLDPQIAVNRVLTMQQIIGRATASQSFSASLVLAFALLSLLLAAVGLYGVLSYLVQQRIVEIGIRMALGAQRDHLTGMFVRQGLLLAGIGAIFGVGAAFVTMRFMASILFKVSPIDPLTYAFSTIAVMGIALLACYLPSRRASQVNPVNALRAE
jgi:ABC-type antimicrobial peptide transport system permease subunit